MTSNVSAEVEVTLNPIEFTSADPIEKMNQVYAMCDEKVIHIDSTVQFILDGCSAPILVSMDAMRSSADPFNPNVAGMDEIQLKAPYSAQFAEEGMYVIFCDPSFKSIATCLTISSTVAPLPPIQTVPTLSEWGLIILFLVLANISCIFLIQSRLPQANIPQ